MLMPLKRITTLLFIIVLMSAALSHGHEMELLVLEEGTESYSLRNNLSWIENTNNISIDDLVNRFDQYHFQAIHKSGPYLKLGNTDFWLTFRARNDTHLDEWILDQRFADTHYLDLYVVNSANKIIYQSKSGNLRPFSSRDIPHRRILFDIEMPQGEDLQFFLHYKSEATIHINMRLWHKSEFIVSDHRESIVYGILYGIILLFAIVNLLLLLVFKRPEYRSSLLFILLFGSCLSFYDGTAQTYFSDKIIAYSRLGLPITFGLAIATLVDYWSKTLIRNHNAKVHKISRILIYSWILLSCLSLFIPYRTTVVMMTWVFLVTTPYMIILSLARWRSSGKQAKLLIASLPSLYIGILVGHLSQTNKFPDFQIFEYSIQIGTTFFIILVALSSVMHLKWVHETKETQSITLSKTKERLRAFLDQTQNLIALLNTQGEILEANKAELKFEGANLESILGKPLWEATRLSVVAENKIKLKNSIEKAAQGESSRFEIEPIEGIDLQLDISVWPYYDENHQISMVVVEGRDITDAVKSRQAINDIAIGVSEKIGDKFFKQLSSQLAKAINVEHVFVGLIENLYSENIHVLAHSHNDTLESNIELPFYNSPFKHILKKQAHLESNGISKKFPNYPFFTQYTLESYLGIPLVDSRNNLIGIIAVFDREPLADIERINRILQIFIARAEAEIQRKLADIELEKAQRRLQLHTQNTPLAVIELDIELKITGWNSSASLTFGYTKEEAIGKQAVDLLTNTVGTDYDEAWISMMSNRNGHYSRIDNVNKHGEKVVCDWYNTLLIDDDGEMFGVASFVVNVSAEQKAVHALELKEKEHNEILDFMVDAVITITEKGEILTFNKAAERLFEYSANEVIGKNVSMLMPVEYSEKHDSYLENHVKTGEKKIIGAGREVVAKKQDGTTFPIRLSVAHLPNENNQMRFIGTCQDLSEQKHREEQLRRSQKMDALGKLTGGVAHDFNNLLGVIMGYADLLENMLDDQPKLSKYSNEIHRACERGANLTKKLLGFSRQQLPTATVSNINTLLENGKQMLARGLTARVNIHYQLTDDPFSVFLDQSDFEDAILNLSINAMHAMEDGGDLYITTENRLLQDQFAEGLGLKPGDYLILTVRDTGKGMDDTTQSRIFDPFFTTKGDGGSGLGLSQVYGFVKRSHGAIDVVSTLGEGSTFTLYFPRHSSSTPRHTPTKPAEQNLLAGSETILFVDDEESLLTIVDEAFTRNGYTVHTADSANAALNILNTKNVSLMVSDVIMPGIDGYELANRVKQNHPDTKIILASGYTENRHLTKENANQQFPFVQKPYRPRALLKQIRATLDAKQEST